MLKTTILLFISVCSFAQMTVSKTYKSSCGKVFSIGDTLKLGIGSQGNKNFAFVYHITGGSKFNKTFANSGIFNTDDGLKRDFNLTKIVITDFEEKKGKTFAVFDKSRLGKKIIEIEPAIITKEILVNCE